MTYPLGNSPAETIAIPAGATTKPARAWTANALGRVRFVRSEYGDIPRPKWSWKYLTLAISRERWFWGALMRPWESIEPCEIAGFMLDFAGVVPQPVDGPLRIRGASLYGNRSLMTESPDLRIVGGSRTHV